MRVSEIHVTNFRLLENVHVRFDAGATVIVGQNNSGKTSMTEICRRMLAGTSPTFRAEDFSAPCHNLFWEAFRAHADKAKDEDVRAKLPSISSVFVIDYSDSPQEVGILGDSVIDLDDNCAQAHISVTYSLRDGAIAPFFDGIADNKAALFKAIRERVPKFFSAKFEAIDPTDPANRKALEPTSLGKLVGCAFIGAQRTLSDDTQADRAVLGKILESLFKAAGGKTASPDDQKAVASLREAVSIAEDSINAEFNAKLDKILPSFKTFGYPRMADPEIRTQTDLDVDKLLSNHTSIGYHSASPIRLPESFNGLGPRNLIFILLKLIEAYKSYTASAPAPVAHMIFIEEPEAHLHPQMQATFIRQIEKLAAQIPKNYGDNEPWPVQFVVTTHSSHIANEAPFDHMRYFSANSEGGFNRTEVKDLCTGLKGEDAANIKFLHEYMTQTRCDLLFADICILVEGAAERLFLPSMIRKFDEGKNPADGLSAKYISTVEVGGAHAKVFFRLLDFLRLKTLVITDIDSVTEPAPGERPNACPVHEGSHTSNPTINAWFAGGRGPKPSPSELLAKTDGDKLRGPVRIAYQIPENDGGPCGRSFEDAFILANRAIFGIADDEANSMATAAYREAREIDKTDFAVEYGIGRSDWRTPKYILDGLSWLSTPSVTAATPSTTAK